MQKLQRPPLSGVGLILAAWLAALLVSPALAATNLYVDQSTVEPTANQNGSSAHPFKTIQQAANVAVSGDTVLVRNGTYRETVTIPAGHDGNATAGPVTFKPDTGATVTISGADPVANNWSVYSGKIYQATGVTGWASTQRQADQVFYNGKMMLWARYPNSTLDVSRPEFFKAEAVSAPGGSSTAQTYTLTDSHLGGGTNTFQGAQIYMIPAPEYQGVTGTVTGSATNSISLQYNQSVTNGTSAFAGMRYYLEGKLTLLDSPGEWYRDASSNTLYFFAPDGANPGANVEIKRRDYGFLLDGRQYVTIQGFNFFACNVNMDTTGGEGGVGAGDGSGGGRQASVAPANHIILDGLTVKYPSYFHDQTGYVYLQWTQNTGLVVSGSDNIVRNCVVEYSAGNGISLIGRRNKALNNIVHDCVFRLIEGGCIGTGFQNAIKEDIEIGGNTLYASGKSALMARSITCTGGLTAPATARIHHNILSNAGLQARDTGIVYTWLADYNFDPNWVELDHNVIFGMSDPYAGAGVYLDGYLQHWSVHHNLIYDVKIGVLNQLTMRRNNFAYNTISTPVGSVAFFGVGDHPDSYAESNIFNGGFSLIGNWGSYRNNIEKDVNPLFNSVPLAQFWLQSNSPAINAGSDFPPYKQDAVGTPDIGAFEYSPTNPNWTAGSSLTSPTAQPPVNPLGAFNGATRIDLSWTNATVGTKFIAIERQGPNDTTYLPLTKISPSVTTYSDTGLTPGRYLYRLRTDDSNISRTAEVAGPASATAVTLCSLYTAFGGGDNAINNSGGSVGSFDRGNYLRFNNISFPASPTVTTFTMRLNTFQNGPGHIEAWVDDLPISAGGGGTGTKIADLAMSAYSYPSFTTYQDISGNVLTTVSGTHTLYLLAAPTNSYEGDIGNVVNWVFGNGVTGAPNAPTNLQASRSGTTTNLTWNDNSSGGGSEAGFRIERSTDNLDFLEVGKANVNATSFADSGLTATTYYYRVRAFNGNGQSDFSNTVVSAPGAGAILTSVRYWPRATFASRMVGGKIQGSNDNANWTDLATITTAPSQNAWTTQTISNTNAWTYLRYLSPNGGWGNVAEIEFYSGSTKLTGVKFGTPGSYNNAGDTFDKAEDGNTSTFFDGPNPDGNYVGIALQAPPAPTGLTAAAGNAQANLSWTASASATSYNVKRSTTSGGLYTVIATGVTATTYLNTGLTNGATYFYVVTAVNANGESNNSNPASVTPTNSGNLSSVRFWPRSGFSDRMVGGKIQVSNNNSTWTDLATISSAPAQGAWTTLNVLTSSSWRYVRYLSPNGSWGNVAEIEFYNGATKLGGTKIGTSGSYNNGGDTFDKAEDGNTATFFDGSGPDGNYVGLDTQGA